MSEAIAEVLEVAAEPEIAVEQPAVTDEEELIRRATIAAKEGNAAEARQLLADACRLNPMNANAWLWRTSLAETPNEALGYLDAVMRVDPGNAMAKSWIARLSSHAQPEAAQAPPPALKTPPPGQQCPFCSNEFAEGAARCPACSAITRFDLERIRRNAGVNLDQIRFAVNHYRSLGKDDHPEVCLRLALCYLNSHASHQALQELRRATELGVTDEELAEVRTQLSRRQLVVLIQNDPATRDALTHRFEVDGFRTLSAESAETAMSALGPDTPAVVVVDGTDAAADGIEACRVVRRHPKAGAAPVVLLAQSDNFVQKMRVRVAGATEYITTDIDADELLAVVRRHASEKA